MVLPIQSHRKHLYLRHLRPQIDQKQCCAECDERFHQYIGSIKLFKAVRTDLVTVVPLASENRWTLFLKRLVTLTLMKQSASCGTSRSFPENCSVRTADDVRHSAIVGFLSPRLAELAVTPMHSRSLFLNNRNDH